MTEPRQRAILVGIDTGEYDAELSLAELAELADTAGAEVLGRACQRRRAPDPASCIGAGMLEEVKAQAEALEADTLIFDLELSASQLRNITDRTGLGVVDRTMLILDIFAQRARTSEGKLQVELAQLQYRLPRLSGAGTALSRLGGGIGTRGPGESKLESDRRHIRRRIDALKAQLAALERRRENVRRRRKDVIPSIAIVGYTNVGKSALLNRLTAAGVLEEDRLFATLDPTVRRLVLPDNRAVLVVDTVGLVRRLPHQLVEAFHSTLEEATHADLLLQLVDITAGDTDEQLSLTAGLLEELGCGGIPVITAFNKCDLAQGPLPSADDRTAYISAKTGVGVPALLEKIARALPASHLRMRLLLPYAAAGLAAEIREEGTVFWEECTADGLRLDANVPLRLRRRASAFPDALPPA